MTTSIRTILNKNLRAGESTGVTVILGGDTKGTALMEIPLAGWTLTRISDNAFAFRPDEWVWKGTEVVMGVLYLLTAPQEIPAGIYQLSGNIMHADGIRKEVEGDTTIEIIA